MLLVVLLFFVVFAVSGCILERQEKKQLRAEKEKSRRIERMQQQKQADDLNSIYQDLMFDAIWQEGA